MKKLILTSVLHKEEAEVIAKGIAQESDHMIAKTPEEIFQEFRQCGGLVARVSGEVAWLIKLSVLDESHKIYERGSLFVLPEFRAHGIGRTLIEQINSRYQHLSLLSVTNVDAVKKINNSDALQKYCPRENLGLLLPIIEGPQPLLDDDEVFVNTTLLARINHQEFYDKQK